jgi:hypothetical protein
VVVEYQLAGFISGVGKPEPVDRIVQTTFQKLEENFSGDPFPTLRFLEGVTELVFQKAIQPLYLLFFS